MNFILPPNTAAQYNIERKIEIQNIQVIQKKLQHDGVIKLGNIQYQTELNLSIICKSDLINDNSSLFANSCNN